MARSPRLAAVLALLAFLLMPLFAAPVLAAEEVKSEELVSDYGATLYDTENGLDSVECNAIAQTADGYIWIGTNDSGIACYDPSTKVRAASISRRSAVTERAIT